MPQTLDGLVSFFSSHYAIRANTLLTRAGICSELIPGPKELSPNCGVALRIAYDYREEVRGILREKKVEIDAIQYYQLRADSWVVR